MQSFPMGASKESYYYMHSLEISTNGIVGVHHSGKKGPQGNLKKEGAQPWSNLSTPHWSEKTPVAALMRTSRAAAVRSALLAVFHYAWPYRGALCLGWSEAEDHRGVIRTPCTLCWTLTTAALRWDILTRMDAQWYFNDSVGETLPFVFEYIYKKNLKNTHQFVQTRRN